MASSRDTPEHHYVKGQQVTHTEDLTHEFKGHRSISVFDLPPQRSRDAAGQPRKTRNAVSATLGGMLNTGLGGTVYLGVSDDGKVVGLPLTQHQQEHVIASLTWTFAHFTPPVTHHRYRIVFVPVLLRHAHTTTYSTPEVRSPFLPSAAGDRGRGEGEGTPHHVATPRRCWCDEEAGRKVAVPQEWVVEIHLRPWEPSTQEIDPLPPDGAPAHLPPLPPLHLTEANVCYYRNGSRQVTLSLDMVRRLLAHRTHRHYSLQLAALQGQLGTLRRRAKERGVLGAEEEECSGGEGSVREEREGEGSVRQEAEGEGSV